jgi:hypothetical protein
MSMPREEEKFRSLAAWVARGRTIRSWCKKNSVSYDTATEWSPLPEFRDLVARLRQESLDTFVGTISASSRKLAKKLLSLSDKGERGQIVQLQATRGAIADMIGADEAIKRDQQIAEILAEIADLKKGRGKDETGPSNVSTP